MKRIRVEAQEKSCKTDDQVHAGQETEFMLVAKENIPKLFECLAHDGPQQNEHSKLMGFIMGYLSILTGYRAVVITVTAPASFKLFFLDVM